jgi:hypothetical protein
VSKVSGNALSFIHFVKLLNAILTFQIVSPLVNFPSNDLNTRCITHDVEGNVDTAPQGNSSFFAFIFCSSKQSRKP